MELLADRPVIAKVKSGGRSLGATCDGWAQNFTNFTWRLSN